VPPQLLVDITGVDLTKTEFGIEEIRKVNAHRHEFELLDGVIHLDREQKWAIGYKQTSMDDFWVRGHVPGRPLMPGVLMAESAGQLCSFVYRKLINLSPETFLGFAGMNNIKFRGTVTPGERVLIVAKSVEARHRRVTFDAQSFVGEKLVFEGQIIGMPV